MAHIRVSAEVFHKFSDLLTFNTLASNPKVTALTVTTQMLQQTALQRSMSWTLSPVCSRAQWGWNGSLKGIIKAALSGLVRQTDSHVELPKGYRPLSSHQRCWAQPIQVFKVKMSILRKRSLWVSWQQLCHVQSLIVSWLDHYNTS